MSLNIKANVPINTSLESSLTYGGVTYSGASGASGTSGSSSTGTVSIADVTNLQTSLDAKLNDVTTAIGTNVTVTGTDLNLLNGLAAYGLTSADLKKLADVNSATSTEIDYLSGVTSSIQTQLDGKVNNNYAVADQIHVSTGSATYVAASLADVLSGTVGVGYDINSLKAPSADFNMNGHKITNISAPANATDVANKSYVDIAIAGVASPSTMTADLDMDGFKIIMDNPGNVYFNNSTANQTTLVANGTNYVWSNGEYNVGGAKITNALDPVAAQDLATKNYVDVLVANTTLPNAMTGDLDMDGNKIILDAGAGTYFKNSTNGQTTLVVGSTSYTFKDNELDAGGAVITNASNPSNAQDVATKNYVDTSFIGVSGGTMTGNLVLSGSVRYYGDELSGTPTYTFNGDADTGIGSDSANKVILYSSGSNILEVLNSAGVGSSIVMGSTDSVRVPIGTTAQRPSTPVQGDLRYNSDTKVFEGYVFGGWADLSASPNVLQSANNLSDLTSVSTAITNLGLDSGGASDIWINYTGDTMTGDLKFNGGRVLNSNGSATFPSYTFDNDQDTGLYVSGTNEMSVAVNGTQHSKFMQTGEIAPATDSTQDLGTSTLKWKRIHGVTTSATYADLAERYEADAVYEEGTVLVIGGTKEVTVTDVYGDTGVAGIVSINPAFRMNDDVSKESWPFVALAGRVPCKVTGPISKGDRLGTSSIPGHAASLEEAEVEPGSVIGIALEDNISGQGIIEVMVRSA